MVYNGHMPLDGPMGGCVSSILYVFTFGGVRSKASVRPHVSYDILMLLIVKEDALEFICRGQMNNGILCCEYIQDCFESVVMYKTLMTHANAMKKSQWEGLKPCAIFGQKQPFCWASGIF